VFSFVNISDEDVGSHLEYVEQVVWELDSTTITVACKSLCSIEQRGSVWEVILFLISGDTIRVGA